MTTDKTNATPQFLFVTCNLGAEKVLKKEMGIKAPDFRFAFSRPGFLTFKYVPTAAMPRLSPAFEMNLVFGQAYGLSLGKVAATPEAVVVMAEKVIGEFKPKNPLVLHAWTRAQKNETDSDLPGVDPRTFNALGKLTWTRDGEKRHVFKLVEPKPGDLVFDLIAVEPDEWWVGVHTHTESHSRHPGARPPIEVPLESPSRAYLKMEEAIDWSGAPIRTGDVVVELGSAPGGSTLALLKRGLLVTGIDPAMMDERVAKHPNFYHIQSPVGDVGRSKLPPTVQWIVLDMNVAPGVSLFAVDHYVSRMKESLIGVLLTVKLNEWRTADEIPSMFEHLKAMGLLKIRAKHLPSNRQEVFIYGLTQRGLIR